MFSAPGVSKEQISKVREIDLLSYMERFEPHELVPQGPGRYVLRDHDSFVISKGKWKWNSQGIGGFTALDYLVKVRNMHFVQAVELLTGEQAGHIPPREPSTDKLEADQKELKMPWKARFATHLVSYLYDRGIHSDVIKECFQKGLLYEGKWYGASVCVFVGKDEHGKERFAAMRGIASDLKQDAPGSDKRYSFCLPATNPKSRNLAVFEAPIDAMSHATMQKRGGWDWDGHRLSLGGTSPVALEHFLQRHSEITNVTLHLDADRPGYMAARIIHRRLAENADYSHIKVKIKPPSRGADYNDALLNDLQREREQKQLSRQHALAGHSF